MGGTTGAPPRPNPTKKRQVVRASTLGHAVWWTQGCDEWCTENYDREQQQPAERRPNTAVKAAVAR